jgi:hypothetical protein
MKLRHIGVPQWTGFAGQPRGVVRWPIYPKLVKMTPARRTRQILGKNGTANAA